MPVRELVDLAVLGAGPAGATAAIAALRRRPDATDADAGCPPVHPSVIDAAFEAAAATWLRRLRPGRSVG